MMLPAHESIRSLVAASAALRAEFGKDLSAKALVLPTAQFFPDVFSKDARGARTLVSRMRQHAEMLDIPIGVNVVSAESEGPDGSSSCGTCAPASAAGAFARLVDSGDEWKLQVTQAELAHPVALTTAVARALSSIFLAETRRDGFRLPAPEPITVDLLAVELGFGVLLMEGAYIYQKSCGGPNVAQLTALGLPELAVATALFSCDDPRALKRARAHMGTTQAAELGDARAWLNGNAELAQQLRKAPELLVGGAFQLGEPKVGLFSWLSSSATRGREELPLLTAKKAPTTKQTSPVDDELKQLVSEALQSR